MMSLFLCKFFHSCKEPKPKNSNERKSRIGYDMHKDLFPHRLMIVMCDFSWLFIHYTGEAFEYFDKVTEPGSSLAVAWLTRCYKKCKEMGASQPVSNKIAKIMIY